MGNIVLLDDLTINQIAAGEVIERPINVVKELTENSIDAGATNIVVEIKKGGKTFIKITDNGKGMDLDDIPLAIERHATSKIRKVEDLNNTYTMGFRGEALASISSISNLTIITKTENSNVAYKVKVSKGDFISLEEVPSKTGTTMIVEDLFFNIPVRYKFLKQDQTEGRYIKEFIQKLALANPNVAIKLIFDSKEVFKSVGNGKLEDIIYTLYGKEVVQNLTKVNFEDGNDLKVSGYVGTTQLAKDTRKNQIVFLNKRNISNNVITKSADQAFKGGTGIGKFGFFILNIELPATEYDVNVHPTKKEVRFKDEDRIYKAIYYSIKNAILNKDFLGNNENDINKDNYIKDEFNFLTNHFSNGNSYIRRTNIVDNKAFNPKLSDNDENYNGSSVVEGEMNIITRDEKRKINYKYLGIVFKTFILLEIDDEMYMMDQHAAHERLLYEKIKENYKKNISTDTQMSLIPEIYHLTTKEYDFVMNNMEMFKNIGFEIDEFGDNSIKVNGFPNIEYKISKKNVFLDVLDEMISGDRNVIKDVEERFIATVACKAAVKANMVLGKEEVENLVENLLTLKNPYTCPHGRPTTIKFNKKDFTFNDLMDKQ